MATKQDIEELKLDLKQDIQELRLALEKYKVDVELIMSKGNEKNLKLTLTAVTLLTVFCGLFTHFS